MRLSVDACVVALCLAAPVLAGPSAEKAMSRRLEADAALDALLRGGNVQSTVARVQYLGEQAYAAEVLEEVLRKSVQEAQRRELSLALSMLAVPHSEAMFVRMARDPDPVVRMHAATGLGRIRSRAAKALVPLLSDGNLAVRREAARALGEMRAPALGKLLVAAAKTEGEPEVRAVMLVAAGQSGDKQQQKALEKFLASSSETTRMAAARGLCGLGARSGFEYARRLLSSADRWERRQALAMFEGFPAKNVAPVLRPLLQDQDRAVAAGAARILYQGGDKKMLEWLVVASYQASGDDKLAIERELEPLHLADDQRKAILVRAGVLK